MADLLFLIPLLTLLAFVINLAFGRDLIRDKAHWVALPLLAGTWVFSILAAWEVWDSDGPISQHLYTWIPSGRFHIDITLYVDQLTAVMLLVVSTVGLLVHIYSVGYMKGDAGFARFFALMPFFEFSMLMLVLASDLLVLFIFWEAVGLCSYALIGFYYKRRSATNAGKKAFIVVRVGDVGFGLGIMAAFWTFGTLEMHGENGYLAMAMNHQALGISVGALTLIGLLLFAGAIGKSAQFPLHVWLPDAMEGPTPVSALMHAATMVTAGIYAVARNYTIFINAKDAMLVVAIIGSFTAFLAATIALTQFDIKKVVAYSTISQLGYMAFALGTGAWAAAIFHLVTHAFFKGLLFLGCGSVMHGMHDELDMRKMGGLRKHMPITFWTFLIASLANAGVIPLAGFWSKDETIVGAWVSDSPYGKVAAILGLLTAFLTALYMFRLVFVVFFGKERFDPAKVHPHEAGGWMAIPMLIMAVFAALIGFIGFPPEKGIYHEFIEKTFAFADVHHVSMTMTVTFGLISTICAVGGIYIAYLAYMKKTIDVTALAEKYQGVYQFLYNKWYMDALYHNTFVVPGTAFAAFLWKVIDVGVIDAAVNGVAYGIGALAQRVRHVQTGLVANYALGIALGMIVIIGVYLAGFSNLFR